MIEKVRLSGIGYDVDICGRLTNPIASIETQLVRSL